eukprot:21216-Chlamydomonas_euryale.AAC.10
MQVVSVASSSSRADLEDLLRSSHVVSLHCPLNARTHGLLGAKELAMMRRGALLVNCARGAVIDKAALLDALQVRGSQYKNPFSKMPTPTMLSRMVDGGCNRGRTAESVT